jgi:hypothetical protein
MPSRQTQQRKLNMRMSSRRGLLCAFSIRSTAISITDHIST